MLSIPLFFKKVALANFNTRVFSTLEHLPFFKTKLVSNNIKFVHPTIF